MILRDCSRQKAFREIKPEEIAKMIQPFILRRDKKTVLADLPEKLKIICTVS